jgi:hypothetical protein
MLTGDSVVSNFLFAHQTDVLADETMAATLRKNSNELLLGIYVNKHFAWIRFPRGSSASYKQANDATRSDRHAGIIRREF